MPISIGGIMGLQMPTGMEQPWVPTRLRQRPLRRASVRKLLNHTLPALQRLQRMCQPRMERIHRSASMLADLFLTLLGSLLPLPTRFTSYLFGTLMIAHAPP